MRGLRRGLSVGTRDAQDGGGATSTNMVTFTLFKRTLTDLLYENH